MEKIGTVQVNGETLVVKTHHYQNGRTALLLDCTDGSAYATVSVNLPDHEIEAGAFAVSHDMMSHILTPLMESGLVVDTGQTVSYGFVKNQPIWKLA